ncbi:hypothetical protein D3C77_600700 [compost metagenome]
MDKPNEIEFFDFSSIATTRRPSNVYSINIQKTGRLSFGRKLIEDFFKEEHSHVLVGYSQNKSELILKFTTDEDPRAALIKTVGKTHYISATSFFRAMNLDLESVAGTHTVKLNGDLLTVKFG